MLLEAIGPPRRCRGGVVMIYWFRGPRVNLLYPPYARGGADGQAVVCRLLRGSSPTRGVAPKQENKAIADQSPLLKLSQSPIPKNVYASAIGLCKDSIIMQSRKPSNSDF